MAYLVSQYPAVNHTYLLREITELRKLGFEIEVASVSEDTRVVSQLTEEERVEAARTWYVKAQGATGALGAHLATLRADRRRYFRGLRRALGLGGNLLWNFFFFTEALLVGQWMKRCGLKHAHIHFASTVGLLLAHIAPVTISITIHGSAEFAEPKRFHLAEKLRVSEFVCVISNYAREELLRLSDAGLAGKIEVVPLGIDTDTFRAAVRPKRSEDATVETLSVGRLSAEKGFYVLVDAVGEIISSNRGVRLRIVGEGPEREALELHIARQNLTGVVSLVGALNQNQLRKLYAESDVFALASFAEGVPVVLMEAMAMEIPCVATRIAGIPELIEDGVDGLLAPPGDAEQLAAGLSRLIDDEDFRARIGTAGRTKVVARYNLAKNTAKLAGVFEARVPKQQGAQELGNTPPTGKRS